MDGMSRGTEELLEIKCGVDMKNKWPLLEIRIFKI